MSPNESDCSANFNAVRRQLRAVDRFQGDPAPWDPMLQGMADARARRTPAAGQQGSDPDAQCVHTPQTPIELLDNGPGRSRLPVVAGEIIVAGPLGLQGDVQEVLRDFGFNPDPVSDPVPASGDDDVSVARFEASDSSYDLVGAIDALHALAKRLGAPIVATPNGMMAMNVITKSKSGAEPACCHPDDDRPFGNEAAEGAAPGLVVVIDSGVVLDGHAGAMLADVTGDADPSIDRDGFLTLSAGHGTFIAGVIRQAVPSTCIHVMAVLDGQGYVSDSALAAAIRIAGEYIADNAEGFGVINLSLGEETYSDIAPQLTAAELARLPEGVAVVAAAGNTRTPYPVFPGAFSDRRRATSFDSLASVSSLDRHGRPSSWSNDESDFAAVGEGVVSTYVEGEERPGTNRLDDPYDPEPDIWFSPKPWAVWTGTSFAAPQVAAHLARILATERTTAPDAIKKLKDESGRQIVNFGHVIDPGDLLYAKEPS